MRGRPINYPSSSTPLSPVACLILKHKGQSVAVLIDQDDLAQVARAGAWSVTAQQARRTRFYVQRGVRYPHVSTQSLHRFLMNPGPEFDVDHINGNGLDNRRCNLRICTRAENLRNSQRSITNTSGYKGVWLKREARKHSTRPWVASIYQGGLNKFLGAYSTPQEAARRYDAEAKHRYGTFARLNFPETDALATSV